MWTIEIKEEPGRPGGREIRKKLLVVLFTLLVIPAVAYFTCTWTNTNVRGEIVAEGGTFPGFAFPGTRCRLLEPTARAWITSSREPYLTVEVRPDQVKIWNFQRDPKDPSAGSRWRGLETILFPQDAKADPALRNAVPCANFRSDIIRRRTWLNEVFRKIFPKYYEQAASNSNWWYQEDEGVLQVELDCQTPQLGRIRGRIWSNGCMR